MRGGVETYIGGRVLDVGMCKGRGQLFKEAYDAARGRKLALALRDSIAAGARNKFAFTAINREK
jgi:hypothetical protein